MLAPPGPLTRASDSRSRVTSSTSSAGASSIFPDGQLGNNAPMTNSVKAGTLDAVVTDVSHISVAVPETDVFNLPFLYDPC